MTTRIETLGGLRIHHDGVELTQLPARRMQCALLVHIAVERRATRDSVMALLWPESDAERARRSLNNTAYELRGVLGEDWVSAHGDELRAADHLVTDLSLLQEAVDDASFAEAVALARGGFLEGTHLAPASGFEQWVDQQRARAARLGHAARKGWVQARYADGRLSEALDVAREWAIETPLDDEAQYWLIRLLAEGGHRAEALERYDRFRDLLDEEFGFEPDPAVRDLVGAIREGEVTGLDTSAPTMGASSPDVPPPPSAKPEAPTAGSDAPATTPDHSWRPPPGLLGRVLKTVGAYVAISAGALQGVDLLISYYPTLPPSFFEAALVLLLCGLPVVTATVFVQSQPVASRDLRGLAFFVARWFSWRNAGLGGVAAIAAWTTALIGWNLAGSLGLDDSVVVVGFHSTSSTEAELALTDALADEVTRELGSWDSIRVVPPISLNGPMFDLGLTGATVGRAESGVALARMVRAARLAAVTVDVRNDSAFASVTLFDVRRGRPTRDPIRARGPMGDLLSLAVPITYELLGLDTLRIDPEHVRRGTRSREALAAHSAGMRQLERWRLTEAEEDFRRAISADDEFGLAHHRLAQALYWRSARTPRQLNVVGPEIAAASARAVERSTALSYADRTHIAAFHAFQAGDFVTTRRLYGDLLARDSADVYAWLMLGSAEYRDPWLETATDSPRPRANLNLARRAFSEALRYQPSFDLGYGHLFDIHRMVESVAEQGSCGGYALPTEEIHAVWDPTWSAPEGRIAFCPVLRDSIEWLTRGELEELDHAQVQAGADRLLADAMRELRRWTAYAELEPTPREQMALAWLRRRDRLGVAPPERIRELADSALRYSAGALALRADTLAEDLLRLSAFHLATGDAGTALAVNESGLRRMAADGSDEVPAVALSVYLATGQPSAALDLIARRRRVGTFFPDSVTGTMLAYGDADAVVDRLVVLGATGVAGETLRSTLAELDRVLGAAPYDDRQRTVLRRSMAVRLAPALLLDRIALERWDEMAGVDEPWWQALVLAASDSTMALSVVRGSPGEGPPAMSAAAGAYLQGAIAQGAGDHTLALARLSRVDSIPLRVDGPLETGWGFRSLSQLMRARSHEALGDTASATRAYRRFLATRAGSDPLSEPHYTEAERRLRVLGGAG